MRTNIDLAEIDIFALDSEVARLESSIPKESGTNRLAILVPLAWHLRQRDTRRAMDLADQAEILLPHSSLSKTEQLRLRARLNLLRAEAQWLFAKIDAALALYELGLQGMHDVNDLAGQCDAYILRSRIATDLGDSVREHGDLLLAMELAEKLQDPLRQELIKGMLAYSAVLQNVQEGLAQWGEYFALPDTMHANSQEMHVIRQVCLYDFHGAVASLQGDFGQSATCFIHSHQAALQTGQLRRAMFIANNIGDAFDCLNDHQTALNWMLQGLELARQSGWPGCIGACLTQTAQVMRHLGRHDRRAANVR